MDITSDLAAAAGHSVDPVGWQRVLAGVLAAFAGRFGRVEPRRAAAGFVTGLLADLGTKTCWQLAEHAGHARPDTMQRLLYRAVWDADAVRDDLRAVVAARFGDPDAVLVVDETGDLKKGTHSVGVQRQYTGTAGRIENAQVGVFLGYAGRDGRTLIDRRVYLPASWTDDKDRCRAAGVPDTVGFATRPQLAAEMITAAVDADLPASAWQRRSAGAGSKGPRCYYWAWLGQVATDADPNDAGHHSLLIRKNTTTGELAFYRCWTPRPATLTQLVRVAGTRWTVEESFQAANSQVGLDQHQVRRWDSWHRFTTLALAALAVLAICAADAATTVDHATDTGLIKLTVNEVRRLINTFLIRPRRDLAHRLHWSHWRRRHQARARRSHYTRRLGLERQP